MTTMIVKRSQMRGMTNVLPAVERLASAGLRLERNTKSASTDGCCCGSMN